MSVLRAPLVLATLAMLLLASACSLEDTTNRQHPQADINVDDLPDVSDTGNTGDDDGGDDDGGEDGGDMDTDLSVGALEQLLSVDETERWALAGLTSEVHVVRTEGNIPHIYADNPRDLYLVEGFVMARDRYVEFELGRRLGLGRASELLGQDALSLDQASRGLGRAAIAQRMVDGLSPEQGEMFDAYAEGINLYIAEVAAGNLPPPTELELIAPLLGGEPSDYMEPVDRLGLAGLLTVIVSELGFETTDVALAEVEAELAALDTEGVALGELRQAGAIQDIFETVGPIKPTIASQGGWGIEGVSGKATPLDMGWRARAVRPSWKVVPGKSQVPKALLKRIRRWAERDNVLLGRGPFGEYGSNVWAGGSSATPDGGSVLASDGHLQLGVPPLFMHMGLDTRALGGGDIHQLGLTFPGVPVVTVGTNGKVAWSQTYLYADITDWYREEIRLGDDGKPADSRFEEMWRPLERIEEQYVIADVPLLGSTGRTETWERWVTFDGRLLVSLEGRLLVGDEEPGPDEVVVNMQGDRIVPGDLDDDGVITGVSFNYTGLDVTAGTIAAVENFHKVDDVFAWREETRKLVAYAQGMVASDDQGNVTYSGYNAVPCREYLERNPDGTWPPGSDPRRLLDGTRYGRPTIPLTETQEVDGSRRNDPYACTIPFENFPQSVNPSRGYVATANNDPAGITTDGSIADDPWYMGYAWAAGYRADTITTRLDELTANQNVTLDTMMELQGDVRSRLGLDLSGELLAQIAQARAWSEADESTLTASQQRTASLYLDEAEALEDTARRIQAWIDRGAQAKSGVVTFYNPSPTETEREDAVATTLFNAWFYFYIRTIFDDEPFGTAIWVGNASANRLRALFAILEGRGDDNPRALASWNPDTLESAFFDQLGTDTIETSPEIALIAMNQALAYLRSSPSSPGYGGYGTDEVDQWLWGLRHMVELQPILVSFAGEGTPAIDLIAGPLRLDTNVLPLANGFPQGDPRADLPWFPRDGDWFSVDAANPGWDDDFTYEAGPVMRMVIALKDGHVDARNIIPGGQSGLTDSPFFADQAALWLGNDTYPMRFHLDDVVEGATGRELYTP
ncbi:MAG: penicillin acylase family protein [Myxococcota bacterium]